VKENKNKKAANQAAFFEFDGYKISIICTDE